MLSGLLGRKVGMTQVFGPNGVAIPVTVIEAGPCVVTQVRTMAKDGYEAAQIGFGEKKTKHETRPMLGHLGHALPPTERQRQQQQREGAKARQEARRKAAEKAAQAETADAETAADEAETAETKGKGQRGARRRHGAGHELGPFQLLREVKVVGDQPEVGAVYKADIFSTGEEVDLIGTSKGKGFAGVMKRHGFRGGPRTHGQSDRARRPGSIGPGTTPGRVYKGTRMAGRMGNERVTVKALLIVQADAERNLLVVKGSVPGPNGGIVLIRKSADTMAFAARSAGAAPRA
ncbi:MAG TPA: 50S ribosomal protein L3 [Ktedonobacterales bacterium]|jgi:large subunit ribosomal protein L3|nr:50S ribosomal protein L3 [Ktedonobacterales bacterium]HEX5572137.1 50S ribosomal protein L3 [Ktedonobacterales bacterium]